MESAGSVRRMRRKLPVAVHLGVRQEYSITPDVLETEPILRWPVYENDRNAT